MLVYRPSYITTDTRPTSPFTITPGAWQGNHKRTSFSVTGVFFFDRCDSTEKLWVRAPNLSLSKRTSYRLANEALEGWRWIRRWYIRTARPRQRWNKPIHLLQQPVVAIPSSGSPACHRLVGQVVKVSASRAEGPGFESRLRRDFFGVESYQ